MHPLQQLFDNNRAWSESRLREDPEFFSRLAAQQTPRFLWVGCADSRVPPSQIVGLSPGDLFVHRNVANVVEPSDINALTVLHFAVEVLRVEHVIVCGHYGCGGIQAAFSTEPLGLIDAWLARIREVMRTHAAHLDALPDDEARARRLAELNALEQALAVCYAPPVQTAWRSGQHLEVHAVIYGLEDGLLKDLGFSVAGLPEIEPAYSEALAELLA